MQRRDPGCSEGLFECRHTYSSQRVQHFLQMNLRNDTLTQAVLTDSEICSVDMFVCMSSSLYFSKAVIVWTLDWILAQDRFLHCKVGERVTLHRYYSRLNHEGTQAAEWDCAIWSLSCTRPSFRGRRAPVERLLVRVLQLFA